MENLIKRLKLPLAEEDELYVSSAMEWLKENTTLEVGEPDELPANASLFIVKYVDAMKYSGNIASESIAGMSQSFVSSDDLISALWKHANVLLKGYLRSQVKFVSATRRWDTWE